MKEKKIIYNNMELWIARDRDGDLRIFNQKPYSENGIFRTKNNDDCYIFIENNKFLEVLFENSPQKIKIELIED